MKMEPEWKRCLGYRAGAEAACASKQGGAPIIAHRNFKLKSFPILKVLTDWWAENSLLHKKLGFLKELKLEILKKNHPRFCAKYVAFVGQASLPRKTKYSELECGEDKFKFSQYSTKSSDLQPGDIVYLAKLKPTHQSEPYLWEIHKITVPEVYWHYESWAKRTPKEQRTRPYHPYAQTWFGRGTYLVTKI